MKNTKRINWLTLTQEIRQAVYAKLDQMFQDRTGEAGWGSAWWIREQIRKEFNLTHDVAKTLHEVWAHCVKK